MKLYSINCALDENLCEVSPPMLPNGTQFDDDDAPLPWDVEFAIANAYDSLPLGDRLITGSYKLVVSSEAKEIIASFAPNDYLHCLPTFIVDSGGKHVADYYYVCPRYRISALDYDKSSVVLWEVEESMLRLFPTFEDKVKKVANWVFDRRQLPDFGIFQSVHLKWIGNEEFKMAVEGANLTGFMFELLWESD